MAKKYGLLEVTPYIWGGEVKLNFLKKVELVKQSNIYSNADWLIDLANGSN